MDGAKGSALEWALALLRAPGERHALRQKPLPGGVDRLLGIAAGAMPEALAEAARIYGEPEARVREAAQFYAREVLFFPQADAYRVLGVVAQAGAEQIKAHHRLLQHWLHPDRLQSEDDGVFAARVNSAWNHLRSPDRRQAYDEALRQNRAPEVFDSSSTLRAVHAWVPETAPRGNRWKHRMPVLALSVACVLLILMVVRDMGRRPEAWDFPSAGNATADADSGFDISVPTREQADALISAAGRNRASTRQARDTLRPPEVMRLRRPQTVSTLAAMKPPTNPTASAWSSVDAQAAPAPAADIAPVVQETAAPPAKETPAEVAAPQPSAPRLASDAAAPSFARIQSARQAGEQFLRYMGAINRTPPPIWNSPAIQSSADRMRHDIHGKGHPRLSPAQWRIGNEAAVLKSDYRLQGNEADAGMLTADLVWREGRWLVTGVSMEQSR